MTARLAVPTVPAAWLDGARHVCCDKDGVLVDVHRYWTHTSRLRAQRLVERFQLPAASADGLLQAMGIDAGAGRIRAPGPVGYAPRAVVIEHTARYLASRSVAASAEELQDLFRDVDQRQQAGEDYDVAMLPGVQEFLAGVKRRGCRLSIYTSDRRDHALRILHRLSLDAYVDEVVGGGCVSRPKPDPEGFLLACARVGVLPEASVYIGDTVEDLQMGRAGGASKVIGVASGLGSAPELLVQTPYVCERLADG